MTRGYWLVLLAAVLMAQQAPKPRPKPAKAPAVERYDPEHLSPGEVACGREKAGVEPCKCMEHRAKASEAAQAMCERLSDRIERAKCMVDNEA